MIALVVCGIILNAVKGVTTSSSTNTGSVASTPAGNGSTPANTPAPANQHFTVGQVVKVGDTWQVTVNSVKTSKGEQFLTPTAGNIYLIVDVTLKNTSGQEQTISSALNFSLQDSTGQKYTETLLTSATPPDGKVEAGSLLRGQLVYEVPTSQKAFTFNFEADIVAGGQTVWDLHV